MKKHQHLLTEEQVTANGINCACQLNVNNNYNIITFIVMLGNVLFLYPALQK